MRNREVRETVDVSHVIQLKELSELVTERSGHVDLTITRESGEKVKIRDFFSELRSTEAGQEVIADFQAVISAMADLWRGKEKLNLM